MKTPNEVVLGVATEMMYTSMQNVTAETICNWATRLCEAMRQSAETAPKRNCDLYKTEFERQSAFIDWYNEINEIKGSKDEIDTCDLKHNVEGILHDYIKWLFAETKEALNTPKRVCDVYTEDQLCEILNKEIQSELSEGTPQYIRDIVDIVAKGVIKSLFAEAKGEKK